MILVTGAAGFIGSSVAAALLQRGADVIGIDNFNDYYSPLRKRHNIAPLLDNSRFSMIEMDFRDREKVNTLFTKREIESVIHLGAMANVRRSVEDPFSYVDTNIMGTTNLLEAAAKAPVKHFVFASTSSVYGRRTAVPFYESDNTDLPLAPYPASKKACECLGHAYFNMHQLNFTALRFFNVYGPKGRPDMMPYKVLQAILRDEEITLYAAGTLSRDWTFIDDTVAGVIAALDHPDGFQIYNLGRGEPVMMTQFVKLAEQLLNKKAKIVDTPTPISEPLITYACVDKAHKAFSYTPKVSLPEGMAKFLEWFSEEVLPLS
ncbi:MAG: NAD-dependent epimerase/dehydratase family protein [Bdellovibrionota bacterium]|jgi:UDP-glucuronate 4-epimerase